LSASKRLFIVFLSSFAIPSHPLLGFLMQGVLSAERAVLSDFHSVRVKTLFFGKIVIPVFALGAFQCYLRAHNFHLQLNV
jgi:hypothetical protein